MPARVIARAQGAKAATCPGCGDAFPGDAEYCPDCSAVVARLREQFAAAERVKAESPDDRRGEFRDHASRLDLIRRRAAMGPTWPQS
jgi:hypothetical protein